MDHCDRCACRCCNHVDLSVYAESVIYDYHCEVGCACTYVTCVNTDGICGNHARACIAFAGCNRDACLEVAVGIQEFSTFFCKRACVLTCNEDLRKDGQKILACKLVELGNHLLVVVVRRAVDGEHAGCFAYAHDLKACQTPVNVACKCCQIIDVTDV